jgi:hypothetical protein
MNFKKSLLIIFMLIFGLKSAFSQVKSHDPGFWVATFLNAKLNSKIGLSQEFHRRYSSDGLYQGLWRPGFFYDVDSVSQWSVGATWLTRYELQNTKLPEAQPSWNFWAQYARNAKVKSWKAHHRARLEYNRGTALDINGTDGYTYEDGSRSLRLRYRFLIKKAIKPKWGVVFYDEFWADMDLKNSTIDFDRNWLYAGGYYKLTKGLTADLGMLYQLINKGDHTESFPVAALSLTYNMR